MVCTVCTVCTVSVNAMDMMYVQAAEQGHGDGAMNLGMSYQYGFGVGTDHYMAEFWYYYFLLLPTTSYYFLLLPITTYY